MSFDATVTYDLLDCPTVGCGIIFGVSEDFGNRRRKDHQRFYCPNGHWMTFGGKTQVEKDRDAAQKRATRLQAEVDRANARAADLKSQRTVLKGKLTKAKNRAAAGVCPGCNRTFKQLAAHMKSQHPNYAEKN